MIITVFLSAEFPKGHCAGGGYVKGIHAMGHGNAHGVITVGNGG